MPNALITGATGFIGKHLLRRLLNLDYKVVVLIRQDSDLNNIRNLLDQIKVHYFDGNYESVEDVFKEFDIDVVFHLAALSSYDHRASDLSNMIESNIKFGTFVLEAMKNNRCKIIINTSSYWQHYSGSKYQPTCLYAATKKAFEDIIDYYALSSAIKATTLKLYDVYGYDDHRKKLISLLFKETGKIKIDLTEGDQLLHMIFIDDVLDGYIMAAQKSLKTLKKIDGHHRIYHLCSEEALSLKQIIKTISTLSGKIFNIGWGKKTYNRFQIMKPYRGKTLPNWTAKTTLENGVKITLKKNYDKK